MTGPSLLDEGGEFRVLIVKFSKFGWIDALLEPRARRGGASRVGRFHPLDNLRITTRLDFRIGTVAGVARLRELTDA